LARSSSATRYARGMAMAFEFTGTIGGGAVLGWYLDEHFGMRPWGSIVLTVAATVGAFVRLIQMLRRFQQLDDGT
jgi:F0F1-type ATP synthase assembly protein I